MPLFTILMGLLLIQVMIAVSLFWDYRGGRVLLLHLCVQMLCWSLLKHMEDPSDLFTYGMEQTIFWSNILLGLIWVDWSIPGRWLKGGFVLLVLLGAASALVDLLSIDAMLVVAGTQIACQLMLGYLLAITIHKQQDASLSAFLGGWLGLLAIHVWTLVSLLWFDEAVNLSSQFIGAFIAGSAACCRLGWLMLNERNQEVEKLREDLEAREESLLLKDEEIAGINEKLALIDKEFKKVERDLSRSQSELYQQAKTTSLGQSSMQINQQLQGILIGSMNRMRRIIHGLEENGHRDSAVCQQLAIILKHMDQATQLTSSLQKFGGSKKDGADTLLNVQIWLSEVISLCDQRLKKSDIQLEIKDDAGDIWVKGRVADLMHALMILINNACEALEYSEIKRITIELTRVSHDDQEWLKVTISDSGQGVPTNIRERIFQPFFSTKHQGQGSGLGLTIASRIFADHGGGVQLDAEALATTFVVELPVQEQQPALQDMVP